MTIDAESERLPPSTYLLRPQRLIFVFEITTIDELKDEIRALQKENDPFKKQLAELLKQRNDGLSVQKKQELADEIKSIRTTISENNQLMIIKEKQILERYRLERGETTAAPILYIYFHL